MRLQGLLLRELSEGQSERRLADSIGITQDVLQEVLAGHVIRDVEIWKKFAAYFRMDLDMLRFGELHPTAQGHLLPPDPSEEVVTYRKVPLRAWSRAARDTASRAVEAMIETDVAGENVFALRVPDDSMQPLFRQGEIIFVNPDARVEEDQYMVVDTAGRDTVLRQMKKIGREYVLHALNPKYSDTTLTDDGHVIGRVTRLRLNL
ncbi:MAG TPA: S24 family peptidase [Nitrospiraceae bacterium]|nr:S24 family peptidase [Nitrospiraceae bacterium]